MQMISYKYIILRPLFYDFRLRLQVLYMYPFPRTTSQILEIQFDWLETDDVALGQVGLCNEEGNDFLTNDCEGCYCLCVRNIVLN